MIVDKLSRLGRYPELAPYEADILAFLRRVDAGLPDGRYELRGQELFALLQHYQTRPKAEGLMESHRLYADLQLIRSGREWIYFDFAEELTVREDRRPGADILFYEPGPDKGGALLSAGMFGYYGPQDAHMPGITAGDGPEDAEKVVFKLRLPQDA